jgi:tRNA threonylcarbamoyladenosine biosynthesis protein TsaB
MKILAVETSQLNGSLSFFDNKKLMESREWSRSGSHSELITVNANELLNKYNCAFSDLSAVACGTGPGSFTGLRVAINFARTFGFLFHKPIFAISSSELLASQIRSLEKIESNFIHTFQYGFRDIIYVASFEMTKESLRLIAEPTAMTLTDIKNIKFASGYFVGTALEIFPEEFKIIIQNFGLLDQSLTNHIHARLFVNTNVWEMHNSAFLQWNFIKPLYVRASEAEEKLRRGALSF